MSDYAGEYAIGPGRRKDPDIPLGDFYALETPNYPEEWTRDQRLCAYWYALGHNIKVQSTHAWHAVLADAQRTADRHHRKVTATTENETRP